MVDAAEDFLDEQFQWCAKGEMDPPIPVWHVLTLSINLSTFISFILFILSVYSVKILNYSMNLKYKTDYILKKNKFYDEVLGPAQLIKRVKAYKWFNENDCKEV